VTNGSANADARIARARRPRERTKRLPDDRCRVAFRIPELPAQLEVDRRGRDFEEDQRRGCLQCLVVPCERACGISALALTVLAAHRSIICATSAARKANGRIVSEVTSRV